MVNFTWRRVPGQGVQDGYDYVATDAWYIEEEPVRSEHPTKKGAYSSRLTIIYGEEPPKFDEGPIEDPPHNHS